MIIRLVRHINTKRAFKSASLGRWGGILQEDSDHKNIDKNTRLLSTVGGNMSREDSEEMIEIRRYRSGIFRWCATKKYRSRPS